KPLGTVHSVQYLARFVREPFPLWVILLPPCNPRQVSFCHRDVFYHPEFRGEFERSLRFSRATRDVTQPAKRHRSVSQATRLQNQITSLLGDRESFSTLFDGVAKIAVTQLCQSQYKINMSGLRRIVCFVA